MQGKIQYDSKWSERRILSLRKGGARNSEKKNWVISLSLFVVNSGFQMTVSKTNTKLIASTNHKMSKQRDQPIRIPGKYL